MNEIICEKAYLEYLAKKGITAVNYELCNGIRNYWDGDEVFYYKDHIERIDYKLVSNFISIELVQVSKQGTYDSWLFNENIHKIVYVDRNTLNVYEFERQKLINLAYLLVSNFDMKRTSTVYREDVHHWAYDWGRMMLKKHTTVDMQFNNLKTIINNISKDKIHLNVAHNSTQTFSGLNIRIPIELLC